jgi:hypothetical protein
LIAFLLTAAIAAPWPAHAAAACEYPTTVQDLEFSAARYPNIREHYVHAVARGWPRIMVIDREGADGRRDRLLRGIPTKAGYDRDEAPAAVLREGWLADVEYVPSSENRRQGASLGAQIRPFCNGVRVRYVWTFTGHRR